MSRQNENGISLATPPAIHVGPIVNPGTNETISIVIPLSAQLATVSSGQKIESSCKDCRRDAKRSTCNDHPPSRPRNDKSKGCPYPGCIRYGRAFSRAHDLKRHIARHEMRKEKLSDYENAGKEREGGNIGETGDSPATSNGSLEESRDTNPGSYRCTRCSNRYATESVPKARSCSREKATSRNACTLCGACSRDDYRPRESAKRRAASTIQPRTTEPENIESPRNDRPDKEDDFLLEEMLLLRKTAPRRNSRSFADKGSSNGGSKIRCDYCSKTFKTKWTLSSHVAAHEGRFQFDCGQCGKKFVRKSHYEGHVRSHEAARPYVCEQCGKTFKELKHRREHAKRKHPTNQNAIQTLLDSIGPCGSDELPADQTKFALLMPVNFSL